MPRTVTAISTKGRSEGLREQQITRIRTIRQKQLSDLLEPEKKKFMTLGETMTFLDDLGIKICTRTLRRWNIKHKLAKKIGGDWYFSTAKLEGFIHGKNYGSEE